MDRFVSVFIFFSIMCVAAFAQSNTSETLTITTYYPSPYGVYKNLRLHPTSQPTTGVAAGVMFYNNTSDTIMYYNKTNKWVNLTDGGGGGASGGYWVEDTNDYISNNNSGGKVIITGPPDGNGEIFQVEGDMRVTHKPPLGDGNTLLYLTRWNQTNSAGVAFGSWSGTDPTGYVIRQTGNPSKLHTGNATANFMTVDRNGNVGIGTINPQQKLHVVGQINSTVDVCISGGKCLSGGAGGGAITVREVTGYGSWNASAVCSCLAGETLIGGGCRAVSSNDDAHLVRSYPVGNPPTSWSCYVAGLDGSGQGIVSCLCR